MNNSYNHRMRNRKITYEHRRVWIEAHGSIPKGFVIHHKNGNKKDNRLSNLELISRSEHMAYHSQIRFRGEALGRKMTDDELKKSKHEYYEKNKKQISKNQKEYYSANHDVIIARSTEWNRKHLERRRERYRLNKDRINAERRAKYKRSKK